MSTQHIMLMEGGAVSIGNDRVEDQDPRPDDDEQPEDDALIQIKRPDPHRPAPPDEPSKDAPSFPPGSPETVPPGAASS